MGTGMDDTSSVRGTIVQWLKTSEKKTKQKICFDQKKLPSRESNLGRQGENLKS